MNNYILLLADPYSIHTKKWSEGWNYIKYKTVVSGISSNIKGKEYIIKGNISSNGGNSKIYLLNLLRFKSILRVVNPVILNPHYLTSYGLIAALIKRRKDFMIMSIHGTDIMVTMDKNKIYLLVSKYIFGKSDIIVSVSDVMTSKILKYFPYLEEKIITQQYGVDISILDEYNSTVKDIDISTNRQWKPNSNYPTILKTLSKISNQNIKIIGAYDDEYSKDLLAKYPSLTRYSTGLIAYEKNLEYIGRSKIFISLTSSDGIPLSLVEAIYLGSIPIVSDIEPNKELIVDGVNGFLVDINPYRLLDKIEYVLNLDDNKIKDIREYNRRLVLEKFDFERNFNNLDRLLKEKVVNAK